MSNYLGGNMRRYISVVLLIIAFGFGLFFFSKRYRDLEIGQVDNKFELKIKYKGLKNARDFVIDNKGNFYIAFPNKIEKVNKEGRGTILFENDKFNIYSITYYKDKLFIVSDCKLISYDLLNKTFTDLISNLPNFGDYKESKLLVKDNILLVSIGAATNSGVVGDDNQWLASSPFLHDVPPKNITISSRNNQKQKTGAFVPYNTKNIAGQIIPAQFPGNASVVALSLENLSSWLYAWGIRNVNGIDYNSEGRIFISTGGMEDRGARPIKGDVDYIYELKENSWYGWPDYSGGDPVTSPRFGINSSERASFILDKHPTTNPPAPLYQHKILNAIDDIVVDRNGALGEKDSIYFYETKDNKIYEINKSGIAKEKLKFNNGIDIDSMGINNGELLILDSTKGYLYTVTAKNYDSIALTKTVGYYLIGLVSIIIVSIMWKLKN